MAATAWEPDVLGEDFRATRLTLPGDQQATLIKYLPAEAAAGQGSPVTGRASADRRTGPAEESAPADAALPAAGAVVIYLHGWSDYFFHRHLAEYWAARGAHFYAIDLRNYGRNLKSPVAGGSAVDGAHLFSRFGRGENGDTAASVSAAHRPSTEPPAGPATAAEAGQPSTGSAPAGTPATSGGAAPARGAAPAGAASAWGKNLETAAREWISGISQKVVPTTTSINKAFGEDEEDELPSAVISSASRPSPVQDLPAEVYESDLEEQQVLPVELPGYIADLKDYGEEMTAALEIIAEEHPGAPMILSGHSTGGLVACLWAADHPEEVAALVLNSPWLEFQYDATFRKMFAPLMAVHARRRSTVPMKLRLPTNYARAVLEANSGQVPYDLDWKPPGSFPVYPAWLAAIFTGHARVAGGLGLQTPVLVMLSDHSVKSSSWIEDMVTADIVLDVDVVARRAPSLGSTVVIERLTDALHDVFLSSPAIQDRAFGAIDNFLTAYGPAKGQSS